MKQNKGLSHDLTALKVWFDECLYAGADMGAEGAQEFSFRLGLAVNRAAALEDRVRLAANVVEAMTILEPDAPAPDNVIAFRPRVRVRRHSNDGDAA
jgi:hypothetical protein